MSISMLLSMASSACPDRVAFGRAADGPSYAQLERDVDAGAALAAAAIAGSVVFLGQNSPALPLLLFAGAAAGVPVAPLNYRLPPTGPARADRPTRSAGGDRRPRLPRRRRPRGERNRLGGARRAGLDRGRPRAGARTRASGRDGRRLGRGAAVHQRHHRRAQVRGASGTRTCCPTCSAPSSWPAAGESDCALISVPPYHVAGVGSALTNVYAGRRMVYLPDFSPAGLA